MKAGSKAKAPRISSSTTQSAASYIWANDSACSTAILAVGPVGILLADLSFAQGRPSANSGPLHRATLIKAPRVHSYLLEQGAARSTRSRAIIGSSESQAASRFRVLLLRFTLRFTLIFLRRRGPFDVLDFVLFSQGILQSFVDRHGEAIGIFAESEAKEFALEVARLTLVLKLKNEEAAVAVLGNIIITDGLLLIHLNTPARYLKLIAMRIFPVAIIRSCFLLFCGGGDPGSRDKHDREKR